MQGEKVNLVDKARIGEWKEIGSFKRFQKVNREGAEVTSAGRAFQTIVSSILVSMHKSEFEV